MKTRRSLSTDIYETKKTEIDQCLTDSGVMEWSIPFSCENEGVELPSSDSSGIGLGIVVGT